MARLLQRLWLLLAFAGTILVPVRARAAICEAHDLVALVTSSAVAPAPPALVEPAPPDACGAPDGGAPAPVMDAGVPCEDPGDLRVPALCDNRGACTIAPPLVHPVADARIETARGCASELAALLYDDDCSQRSGVAIGPGPQHSPAAGVPPVLAEHAVLDAALVVPPASSELGPDFLLVAGGPRRGVVQGIDHPPRAL